MTGKRVRRTVGHIERVDLEVGEYRLAAWRKGRGEPAAVCVHGAGVSSREWLPLVAELGCTRQVWTVDLPGFGASRGLSRTLGLPALTDALVDWLAAARLARVCLIGGSFGCQVAVDAAVRYPDRVSHLVLVGPTVDPAGRTFSRQVVRWLRNTRYELPRMAPLNIADYRDAGLCRVVATFREALADRVEDKLPYVAAPTLVVRGDHDRLVPQAWAEEVTRLLPRGRLAVVPGAGHMVPFRSPSAVAHLVDDFLDGAAQ
jgi:pimeloyl-ACP methyl ester carboxylesterase